MLHLALLLLTRSAGLRSPQRNDLTAANFQSDEPEYRYRFDSLHAGESITSSTERPFPIVSCCGETDSESGMHSVNRGVCMAEDSLALLESSLAIGDARQIVLLAFSGPPRAQPRG